MKIQFIAIIILMFGFTHFIHAKEKSNAVLTRIDLGKDIQSVADTIGLKIQRIDSGIVCVGKEVKIAYASFGKYENGNIFKFSIVSSVNINGSNYVYEIGQSNLTSGVIKFTIPSNFQLTGYYLQVTSSNPNITKTYSDIYFVISTLPNVTLSGSTIVNSGGMTFLNFTNNAGGKTQYTLSDGSKGETEYSKTYIIVYPSKTTTYTITSINNFCGIGKSTGSATVTVNPVSDKMIIIDFNEVNRFPEQYPSICSGAVYMINYKTFGEFSQANKFTAQISDENGENFKDIITEGTSSPVKIITPDDLKPSNNYRIRVVASDKDVSSSANYFPLIFSRKGPTAMFDSSTFLYTKGESISLKINLTGKSPWIVKFGADETSAKYYDKITTSPYIINVSPIESITYKIFSVFDGCPGKVIGTGIVRLELITANEKLSDFEVKLFPNPTTDRITIQSNNFKNTSLQIFDNFGRPILQQILNQSETILNLSNYTNGQYLLQLERDNKRVVYKIQKL